MNKFIHQLVHASALAACLLAASLARADAVDTLKAFVQDVKSARADFTQTVSSPDASKAPRHSQGQFSFQRPNRFRFSYTKPYEQLIVADGQKVWLFDADLNQVTMRPMNQALGATPAALLAGKSLEQDFTLKAMPAARTPAGDLQWVEATPKLKDGQFQAVRVGFHGNALAALEIIDGFGQRSRLDFTHLEANAALSAKEFEFKTPAGAEVMQGTGVN